MTVANRPRIVVWPPKRTTSERDAAFDEWLAMLELSALPRQELVLKLVREIGTLRREGHITDEQAEILLREALAASIDAQVSTSLGKALNFFLYRALLGSGAGPKSSLRARLGHSR